MGLSIYPFGSHCYRSTSLDATVAIVSSGLLNTHQCSACLSASQQSNSHIGSNCVFEAYTCYSIKCNFSLLYINK
nr:hypothetical protein CFP56_63870 [Quercus suber]